LRGIADRFAFLCGQRDDSSSSSWRSCS
jgi:hypothetical protein